MDAITRRAVAYLAGRLISRRAAVGIHDYGEDKLFRYSGSIEPSAIDFTDHEDGHRVTGSGEPRVLSIVHRGTGAICTIEFEGDTFKGFEFQCQRHFNGKLQGGEIMLFDSEAAEPFYFRLQEM